MTHAINIDIVPLVLKESYFEGHIFEYKWKTRQKAQSRKRKAEMCNGIKGESPPTCQTWAKHRCGSHPGPARNVLEQGGGEWAGPGCGHTAPSAPWPYLALAVAWRHATAVEASFLFY